MYEVLFFFNTYTVKKLSKIRGLKMKTLGREMGCVLFLCMIINASVFGAGETDVEELGATLVGC